MAYWEVVDNVISVDFRAKREQDDSDRLQAALAAVIDGLEKIGFADKLELVLDPIPYEPPESDPA